MNKEQEELLDEAYKNYCKSFENQTLIEQYSFDTDPMTQFMFLNKCKTDTEFSQKWGLNIEEKELSLNDRILEFAKRDLDPSEFRRGGDYGTVIPEEKTLKVLDRHSIPTKLITITYKDKTIESYDLAQVKFS
jgi:hypothetical protein